MTTFRNKILISLYKENLINEKDKLNNFFRFIEDAIETESNQLRKSAEKKINSTKDKDEQSNLTEWYYEDIKLFEVDFSRLQRYSAIVSLMTWMETNLIYLCRITNRLYSATQEFDPYLPKVIDRGIKYLQEIAGLDISKVSDLSSFAINLNRIRNCIVHSEGYIKKRKDTRIIRTFIDNSDDLYLDDHERIIIKKGSIEKYLENMYTFLTALYNSIPQRSF